MKFDYNRHCGKKIVSFRNNNVDAITLSNSIHQKQRAQYND